MSRFYQTADRSYVDDFVYQPPLELLMGVLQQKDAEAKETIGQIDLLNNLPLDYIDYDKDIAASIQEEITGQVDTLAQELSTNLLDPNTKRKLKLLGQDINQRMMKGDIYNLSKNVEAYNKFQAELATITDPAAREAYKKQFENYKEINNQLREKDGGFGNIFEHEAMFDTRNLLEDWAKSGTLKNIGIKDVSSIRAKTDGKGYIVTTSSGTVELSKERLENNFKAYVQSVEGIKEYGKSREKYMGEKFLDAQGNIDFTPGSYLGDLMSQAIPTMAYKTTKTSTNLSADPMWDWYAKNGAGGGTTTTTAGTNPLTHNLMPMLSENYAVAQKKMRMYFAVLRATNSVLAGKTDTELENYIVKNKEKHKDLYNQLSPYLEARVAYLDKSQEALVKAIGVEKYAAVNKAVKEEGQIRAWSFPLTNQNDPDNLGSVTEKQIKIFDLRGGPEKLDAYRHIPLFRDMHSIQDVKIVSDAYGIPIGNDVADWGVSANMEITYTTLNEYDEPVKNSIVVPAYTLLRGNFQTLWNPDGTIR